MPPQPPAPPPAPPSSITKPHPNPLSDFIFSAFSLFIIHSSSSSSFKPTSSFNPRRRFFKFPIMPLTTTATKTSAVNHHRFPTPQSLSDWLRPRLPSDSFAAWGTRPGTKNIHNLFLELADGETSLADSTPPVRTVEVVVVRVKDDKNRILIETHQQLSNGVVRPRSRPLSEKMKSGETVETAVIRAVKEELGSVIKDSCSHKKYEEIVKIIPNSYSSKVEERASLSYPGLPACYVLHTVDAIVDGLPDCEFCSEEDEEYEDLGEKDEEEEGAVSCKKHYWKWVDSNTVSS